MCTTHVMLASYKARLVKPKALNRSFMDLAMVLASELLRRKPRRIDCN